MKKVIDIEGMHCLRCADRVKEDISEIANVKNVKVSFKTKKATINYRGEFPREQIESAVANSGYKAVIGDE